MAEPNSSDAPSDETLTAHLDGELHGEERAALEARLAADAESRARFEALAKSNRPYRQAFALLVDAAPKERLTAMLAEIAPRAAPAAPRRVWLTAAAVVLFAVGIAIGVAGSESPRVQPIVAAITPPPNWRQVVAEYLELTTPATLAVLPDNPGLGEAVAAYGPKLKLDVSTDKLMLPMADLKDVRLFDYRGRPLVEAAYLSDDTMTVVTFCVILNGQPDAPAAFETRDGQNIVFWTSDGHGFMVAGKAPREQLEALARNLQAKFTTST